GGRTPCSDIELQMRTSCGGNLADWSAPAAAHVPGCGQCLQGTFCTSKGGDPSYEWIARATLGYVDRRSAGDAGYADGSTTAQSTSLVIGGTHALLLQPGYAGSAFPEYVTVWMDLDRDGQFASDGRVFDPAHTVNSALLDSLTVPPAATPGPAR